MQAKPIEPKFSTRFFQDYTGKVIQDPRVAITEIVANAYDAGATTVDIDWPLSETGGRITVKDNGEGMTQEEFEKRWSEASYNRIDGQGDKIVMPDNSIRRVYGRNGIGRFGMFCFSNEYDVITWKNGTCNSFLVTRDEKPFHLEYKGTKDRTGSGTIICCERTLTNTILVTPEVIAEWLQVKFFNADQFKIRINEKEIELGTCEEINKGTYKLSSGEEITITRFKLPKGQTKNSGILFRVKGRAVGEPSWNHLKGIIDSRKGGVSQFLITVDADFLESSVEPDWSGFKNSPQVKDAVEQSINLVENTISDITQKIKQDRKKAAIKKNIVELRGMSKVEHAELDIALQSIIDTCPSMTQDDLAKIMGALVKMEKSHSKYALMHKLSEVAPDDIDSLDEILSEWSIADAKTVFKEISQRLKVLEQMEKIVDDKGTPEVTVLQPLIAHNLWIFGSEFDSCSFTSNISITNVIRGLFKKETKKDDRRPDFVILPNSTIGVYGADRFDYEYSEGEPRGYSRIVIVELKRGGFKIGLDEMTQAQKYAYTLEKSGAVQGSPTYICYVVGSTLEPGLKPYSTDDKTIRVVPMQYNTLIRSADARLLSLRQKLEDTFENVSDFENDVSETVNECPSINDIIDRKTQVAHESDL